MGMATPQCQCPPWQNTTSLHTTKPAQQQNKKLNKESRVDWASAGMYKNKSDSWTPHPTQRTGPKGSTTIVPVPGTTGQPQRCHDHALASQSCFGCTRRIGSISNMWFKRCGWMVHVFCFWILCGVALFLFSQDVQFQVNIKPTASAAMLACVHSWTLSLLLVCHTNEALQAPTEHSRQGRMVTQSSQCAPVVIQFI